VEVPVFAASGVAVFATMAMRLARSEHVKQVIDGIIPIMATRADYRSTRDCQEKRPA
jgi:hypothetical protein